MAWDGGTEVIMNRKIRVAVCDDAPYVIDCIKMQLDDSEVDIVGTAGSAAECIPMLKGADADVLLIDVQMETETAGIDIIPKIKELFPKLKVIILTSFDDENYVFTAFANGADNYILKSFEDNILQTVQDTFDNTFSLNPNIAKKLVNKTKIISDRQSSILYLITLLSKLSPAEYEVLCAVYDGAKYKEIAAQRFVEECTIKTHAQRIIKKTGVSGMKELIKLLKETQVLDLINNN